ESRDPRTRLDELIDGHVAPAVDGYEGRPGAPRRAHERRARRFGDQDALELPLGGARPDRVVRAREPGPYLTRGEGGFRVVTAAGVRQEGVEYGPLPCQIAECFGDVLLQRRPEPAFRDAAAGDEGLAEGAAGRAARAHDSLDRVSCDGAATLRA